MNTNEQTKIMSVESYKPSDYMEEVWSQVEVVSSDDAFAPANFEIVSQKSFSPDPMFTDFTKDGALAETKSQPPRPFATEVLVDIETPELAMERVAAHDFVEEVTESAEPTGVGEIQEEIEPSEDQILTDTITVQREEYEAALATARQEGYAQGIEEAQAQVLATCSEVRERFGALLEDIKSQSNELLQQHETQAVELAIRVGARMVGSLAETHREYITSIVREAMQAVGGAQIRAIRMSPRDIEFISQQGEAAKMKVDSDSSISFEADESIKYGCIITTSSGEVDFDLEKTLQRLHEKIVSGSSPQ